MANQEQSPKVNLYAQIGPPQGTTAASKVVMYAIVNLTAPPAPPPRRFNISIAYGQEKTQ